VSSSIAPMESRTAFPANLFKIQAPALGKVFLMDIQQEGSLRQVFRGSRNQRPFSVVSNAGVH